jgi:hypothetical protein
VGVFREIITVACNEKLCTKQLHLIFNFKLIGDVVHYYTTVVQGASQKIKKCQRVAARMSQPFGFIYSQSGASTSTTMPVFIVWIIGCSPARHWTDYIEIYNVFSGFRIRRMFPNHDFMSYDSRNLRLKRNLLIIIVLP